MEKHPAQNGVINGMKGDAIPPIAIIGAACRFPGGATDLEKLWSLLADGRSAWTPIPADRMNIDGYYHPDPERVGGINFRGAHFLSEDVSLFDASFFRMSPEEAKAVDPQQRFLLEVSYEALENAGIPMESLNLSRTAVYCGSFVKDYEQICLRDPDDAPQYAATGNGIAIMSNRISHFYNLRGPSLTLDTGCSASLVGFHLACQSLISGESDLGIAMGAGMILTPNTIMPMTSLGFMSPDGKCYTFDARANGYGRGEGIGVVIVKRLEDALRDNDTIRAVVRGSAVNQDGNTPGITMPSMEAQIDNINDVYRKAGLHPEDTAFVECHGTGTQAGDKRELQAVSEAIASKRSLSKGPVVVGSIKTNIGHLEGCAGVAGLIKGILTLEKAMIPKHLNFRLPGNPDIHFEKWRVTPPLELMDFPADGLRRASINCFGFGGTNAHVILDDAFHYLKERKLDGNHNSVEKTGRKAGGYDESKPLARLFVYSSNEAAGIERLAKSHWGYLKRVSSSTPSNFLASYAYTLSARRSNLDWKAYVVGKTLGDVLDKLSSIDARTATKAGRDRQPNIAYLFAGQGAQWTGMGKEMILSAPATLGKSIREASNFMRKHLGSPFDLVGEFLASTSCINDPIIAQPATTVVQVALVDFLASFGISPACVVGHSSGEIAAAYAGGYISREDAWRLSYHRGRCAGILRHDSMVEGKMLAAALTADLAESWINRARAYGRVVVACRNSPTSVTLSGDAEAVEDVAKMLNEAGIFNLILPVSTAYHSHHMLRVADMYLEAIRDVTVLRPSFERKVAMFSSVTGKIVSIEDDLGPEYWVRNMVSPVRFDDALAAMLQISSNGLTNGALNMAVKPDFFVEISPRAALKGYLRETSEKTDVKNSYVCMMYANTEPPVTALEAVGKIWAAGFRVDFKSMAENEEQKPCVLVDMPAYPWNHSKSHWHESHLGAAGRFREHAREDIIGAPVSDWTIANPRWRGFLRVKENPWLRDHKVQGTILYPAAGMVASVVQAASQLVPKATKGNSELDKLFQGYELREVEIPQAMVIPESAHGLEFVVAFQEVEPLRVFEFKITSKALNASWQTNASGTVVLRFAADPAVDAELAVAEQATEAATVEKFHQELAVQQELCTDKVDTADFYVNLDLMGMNYGPQFQNVAALAKGAGALVSTVQVPNTAEIMPRGFQYPHIIHPAVLDAIFHSVFAIGGGDPMVPSHIDSIFVARNFPNTPGETLSGFVTARKSGPRTASAEIVMQRDDQKLPVVVARQLTFTSLGNVARSLDYLSDHRELCSTVIHVRDVDMVTSEEVKNGVGLREWISGITYKYPGMAVLQISGDDYDDYDGMVFTAFILAMRNAVGPECTRSELVRMARYTITDQKCLEICRGLLDGKLGEDMKKCMEFTPADAENAVKYDLVITSAKGLELALARAKPHAFLLVYGPHQAPGDSGFEKRHTVYGKDANDKTVEFTLYRSRPAPVDKSRVEMVLFAPPELEQLANNLAQVLAPKASSITVETTLGGPAVSALGDKYCISLWDLTGRESVVVATEDGFNAFKEMCKRARGILWVMSTWSAAEIRKSMFYGLARAIRSENPQRNVIIADVELGIRQRKSRSVLEKLANGLAEAVDNSLLRASTSASGEIGHETEYQYDATTGVWTIPRLVSLPRVSKYLETETESIQDTLLCPGMKMSLRLGAPGASEPVYFEEDEHCENLAEHDVELRVTKLAFTGAQVQSPRYAGYGAEIAFAFAGRVVRMGDRKASPGGMNGNGTKRTQSDYDDKIEIGAPCIALSSKGVQSYITVDRSQVCRVPHGMQIGEALGLAAYYLPSLFVFEKVVSFSMAGKTVLVIGGGSLAQAAVDVASILGAHVYVAVQDSRSMTVFRDRFGLTLGRDLIADDGGHSLASKLHAVCKGGFDVIFNTSMTAVVPLGQNILSPRGVAVFLPGYAHDISVPPRGTLYRLDMAQLIEDEPALMGTCLRHTFQLSVTSCFGRDRDGRAVNGCNSPSRTYSLTGSPCMMYGIGQLEKAIKTHDHSVGGAVISLDDSHLVRMIPRRRVSARSVISPSHTYLIVGGTSGLGLEMARRLVLLGSRDITLASRTGNEATARKIAISLRLLAKDGNLKVRALAMDVTKPTSVADALRTLESDPNIPPVRGVIVSAACLADAVFDNMSYQAFRHALDPKVDGTLNVLKHFIGGLDKDIPNGGEGPAVRLHHVRRHAKEGGGNGLDFFITLSSAAGIIGNRGQSNYSAGNSFQDGLAQYLARHADELGPGFTFTSIDLGPVLGAGMVANDPVTKKLLARSGFIFVRLQDVGELVERAIVGRRAATGETRNVANEALPPQVVVGSGTGGIIHQNKPSDPFWARTPIFRVLNRVDLPRPVLYPGVPKDDMDVTQQAKASDSSISMKALLAASKSEDEAAYTILEGIRSLLAVRLNMGSKDEVLADMTPATLGVDSLVAVEVVNWAFRDLDIEISTFDVLMEGRTLTDLAWIMANKSDWGTAESGKAPTQEDSKAAVNGSI